jgi:hypothetical protein
MRLARILAGIEDVDDPAAADELTGYFAEVFRIPGTDHPSGNAVAG